MLGGVEMVNRPLSPFLETPVLYTKQVLHLLALCQSIWSRQIGEPELVYAAPGPSLSNPTPNPSPFCALFCSRSLSLALSLSLSLTLFRALILARSLSPLRAHSLSLSLPELTDLYRTPST